MFPVGILLFLLKKSQDYQFLLKESSNTNNGIHKVN